MSADAEWSAQVEQELRRRMLEQRPLVLQRRAEEWEAQAPLRAARRQRELEERREWAARVKERARMRREDVDAPAACQQDLNSMSSARQQHNTNTQASTVTST